MCADCDNRVVIVDQGEEGGVFPCFQVVRWGHFFAPKEPSENFSLHCFLDRALPCFKLFFFERKQKTEIS